MNSTWFSLTAAAAAEGDEIQTFFICANLTADWAEQFHIEEILAIFKIFMPSTHKEHFFHLSTHKNSLIWRLWFIANLVEVSIKCVRGLLCGVLFS